MGHRRDSSTTTEVLEGQTIAVEEREAACQRGAEGRRAGPPPPFTVDSVTFTAARLLPVKNPCGQRMM